MNDLWIKHFESGCKEFIDKQWEQAEDHFVHAVNLNDKYHENWKMLALTSVKLEKYYNAVNQIHACLDLKADDCVARFCADIINGGILQHFFEKTGKQLTLFDDEIVYTTEDEIDIERGTELDPLKFEKELAVLWQGFVQGKWDQVKSKYGYSDEWVEKSLKSTRTILAINFKWVTINPDDRVLEIGSGSGRNLHLLAQRGLIKNIVASDVAVSELQGVRDCFKMAHKNGPIGYVGLLADNLPFKRDTFDVVLVFDVVEHLYHNEFVRMLQEVREIMKPSGRLYIQTPNGFRYIGNVNKLDDGTVNIPEMNGNWQHVAEKSIGYLKKTLYESGYKVEVLSRIRNVVKAEIVDIKY